MNLPVLLLTALGAILLVGCQTTSYQTSLRPEEAREYTVASPDEGYLIGSFSYTANPPTFLGLPASSRYTQYGFFLQNVSKPELKADIGLNFGGFGSKPPNDFAIEGGGGRVFVIPLPAGHYKFYDFLLFENLGQVQNSWKSRHGYSIPIEIRRGEALYIGEIRTVHRYGRNLLGMPLSAGGYFVALPGKERDVPLLHAMYPFLRSVPVREAVLDVRPIFGIPPAVSEEVAASAPPAAPGEASERVWSQRAH
jgi:hypothetical protein